MIKYIILCTLLFVPAEQIVCLQEQPIEAQQMVYAEQIVVQNQNTDITVYEQKYRIRFMHEVIATVGGFIGASIAKQMATKAACLLLHTYPNPNGLTVASILLTVVIPAIAGGGFLGYNATHFGYSSIVCIKKLLTKKTATQEVIAETEGDEL